MPYLRVEIESVRTFDKCTNLFVLCGRLRGLDEINFVLQDEQILELHDLNGREMLRRLPQWQASNKTKRH